MKGSKSLQRLQIIPSQMNNQSDLKLPMIKNENIYNSDIEFAEYKSVNSQKSNEDFSDK